MATLYISPLVESQARCLLAQSKDIYDKLKTADFDGIFKSSLWVHQIPLDNGIGGFELLKFGIVRFTQQVLCYSQESLRSGNFKDALANT